MSADYRTDDPATRTFNEGAMAAIHGWNVCPHTGWHYQREWWMGWKAQREIMHKSDRRLRRAA